MAILIDHANRTKTHGTTEALQSLMTTAAMSAPHARRLAAGGRIRWAEAHVRAAIRRGGLTDVRQELILTDDERAAWELANPVPVD